MRERPILFSGPMVKALLAGTKTQTRRLVKPQPAVSHHYLQPMHGVSPDGHSFGDPALWREVGPDYPDGAEDDRRCPYGVPGDRLWVRESLVMLPDGSWHYDADKNPIALHGGDPRCGAMISWAHHNERERCNSIHMPRWASRITLEVTEVRVERLQRISEEGAKAEGVTAVAMRDAGSYPDWMQPVKPGHAHRLAFELLWGEINGKRASWESDPWVWVVSLKRLEVANA